ncbi:hypothetical protein GIB67_041952 [Kingdonia uniflora]|uniref:Uncharacterized protein n=1 Tax=Kingdonia uniflora TaxID=39325 RepID=A0A7J7NZL5_9MAGN|nr:hypothetical protein GIB67_041952 [Kingdonia uniflora]
METSSSNSDLFRNSLGISSGSGSRRYGMQLTAANIIQAPLSALLEYSGILRPRSSHSETESLVNDGVGVGVTAGLRDRFNDNSANIGNVAAGSGGVVVGGGGGGEVSIQIIGGGEQEHVRVGTDGNLCENGISAEQILSGPAALASASGRLGEMGNEGDSMTSGLISNGDSGSGSTDGDAGNGVGAGNSRDSSYQRYDIQQVARWIEQVLPFSLLLLIVFIRQHLQVLLEEGEDGWEWMRTENGRFAAEIDLVHHYLGILSGFFVTIWIAAVMFKSNDILRKQTALKGERKISVLVSFTVLFMFHVFGVYWWYRNDDLLYPLAMFPPKEIPPFWHAIFIIMVNGMVNLFLILIEAKHFP